LFSMWTGVKVNFLFFYLAIMLAELSGLLF
jgi:hypothetical protein